MTDTQKLLEMIAKRLAKRALQIAKSSEEAQGFDALIKAAVFGGVTEVAKVIDQLAKEIKEAEGKEK